MTTDHRAESAPDVDPRTRGLERLSSAVASSATILYRRKMHQAHKAKAIAFCLLWQPMDTYITFAARHPEWGHAQQVQARSWRLRSKIPSLPKGYSLSGYQVAQAYLLSLPEHLRRPIEP
jgi:hypothetical protein